MEFLLTNEAVSMGTTIMAVEFADGVVLGADSRTSSGSLVSSPITDKLTEITPYIFCCRSGTASHTEAIADVVRYQISFYEQEHGTRASVLVAANLFRDMCYRYRDEFSAGIIIGGWDNVDGGQVYSVPLGGMITRQSIAAGGSGSTYVFGYLDSAYKKGMSQAECEKFVTNAVALAMARDGSSGGVIRLAILTKNGVERKLFTGDEIPKFYEED